MAPKAVTLARGYLAPAVLMTFVCMWVVPNCWLWQGRGDPCENDMVLAVGYSGSRALQGCQTSSSGQTSKVIPFSDVTWSDVCNSNATATQYQTCSVVAVASAIHMTGACVACIPFATYVLAGGFLFLARPFHALDDGCWQQQIFHFSRFVVQAVLFPVSLACVVVMSKLDTTTFPFQHSEDQKLPVGSGFWLTSFVLVLSGVGLIIELFCSMVMYKDASNNVINLSGGMV